MNLQQLRYVREVAANGLSVSKAAKALHTSQPGVSQQIRVREEELGINIFTREKNRLSGLTAHGRMIVERLNPALLDIDYVHAYAKSLRTDGKKELTIITSHTQARYVLPKVLEAFSRQHPDVRVDVKHGTATIRIRAVHTVKIYRKRIAHRRHEFGADSQRYSPSKCRRRHLTVMLDTDSSVVSRDSTQRKSAIYYLT